MVTKLADHIAGLGVSQVAFARLHRLPASLLNQWCNARRRPDRDHANDLEKLTGIPSEYWKTVAIQPSRHRPARRVRRRA